MNTHSTVDTGTNANSCVVPLDSFLPLRKAILNMKDVRSYMCVRLYEKHVEVSVVDTFQCTHMYVHVPIGRASGALDGSIWAFVPSTDLLKLADVLKRFATPITFLFTHATRSLRVVRTNNHTPILKDHVPFPLGIIREQFVTPVHQKRYYWIPLLSQSLLDILVKMCVGSAVAHVRLQYNGLLVFAQKFEEGVGVFDKQLHADVCKQWGHLDPSTPAETAVAECTCVIKFTKQVVNSMVNCSKKTCALGMPLCATDPVAIQFLLVRPNVYEYMLLLPYVNPLPHATHTRTQNPIHLRTINGEVARVADPVQDVALADCRGPQGLAIPVHG